MSEHLLRWYSHERKEEQINCSSLTLAFCSKCTLYLEMFESQFSKGLPADVLYCEIYSFP